MIRFKNSSSIHSRREDSFGGIDREVAELVQPLTPDFNYVPSLDHRAESSLATIHAGRRQLTDVDNSRRRSAALRRCGLCLHASRTNLCRAPHAALRELHKFDDRLANLDGLSIAGEAWEFCEAALESPSAAIVFTAAVGAIEDRNPVRLERLLALAEAVSESRSGLLSAFGWLAREQLQGIVASHLASTEPFRRMVGIAACGMRACDPGIIASRRLQDLTPLVRARALWAASLAAMRPRRHARRRFRTPIRSAHSGAHGPRVLFGNRGAALEVLAKTGVADSCHRDRAFRLALQAMDTRRSHQMLQRLGDRCSFAG